MSSGADVPIRPGDVLAAKYRVERVLGVGGMGVVVAATHLHLHQPVALKFMLDAVRTPEGTERFLREARAAVRLKSENVARVLDVGTLDSGAPYMVMELLEGLDLCAVLEQRQMLPVDEAVEYILQVCDAIAEAHGKGIIHRDLKPANLFLTQGANGRSVIKVLDFGISKAMSGPEDVSLTRTMAVMGSPFYMAPEQMKASRMADGRSDIWSIGVILYELLVGRTPFRGDSITSLALSVVQDDPPPLSTFRLDVPAELEAIIHRCLAKDRNNRFSTATELAVAIEPFRGRSRGITGNHSQPLPPPVASDRSPRRVTPVSSRSRPEFEDTLAHAGPQGADGQPQAGPVVVRTGVTWGGTGGGRVSSYRWPAVGLATVVGVGLGVVFAMRQSDDAKVSAPVPAASAPAPSTFRLEVEAEPASALVELDGQLVAHGRFARDLPRDGVEHFLRVSADGYTERRIPFRDVAPPSRIVLAVAAVAAVAAPAEGTPPSSGGASGGQARTPESEKGTTSRGRDPRRSGGAGASAGGRRPPQPAAPADPPPSDTTAATAAKSPSAPLIPSPPPATPTASTPSPANGALIIH